MKSGIYKISNKVDGKVYIGQSVSVKLRIRNHKTILKKHIHHNELLQRSYNKYGESNFDFDIIELCSLDELDEKEIYWISFYKATNREYGYNFESGGNFNKMMHQETKEKIRLRNRGSSDLLAEDDVREIKMSLLLGISTGELCKIFKVHYSTISHIRRGKSWEWVLPELNNEILLSEKHYKTERKNHILSLFNEGHSGRDIEKLTSYSYSTIGSVLKGMAKNKTEDRYSEIKELHEKGFSKEEIMEKCKVSRGVYEKALPSIHTTERQELHDKILELRASGKKNIEIAKELGVHRTTVTEHIKERVSITKKPIYLTKHLKENIIQLHNQGLSQRKIAETLKIGRFNVQKTLKEIGHASQSNIRVVIQLDKNNQFLKVWESISLAAGSMTVSDSNIVNCCQGKQKTTGGFKWMYKEDYDKLMSSSNKNIS